MKLFKYFANEKVQSHLITICMYIIGVVCDYYGYINGGIEGVAYCFLIAFTGLASALAIIWHLKNKRFLRAARVQFFLLILSLPITFITWNLKMYPTFAFTLIYIIIVAILFIITMCEICFAYYYDDWKK